MAFFPRQHYKRRGARQTAVCDWCGQWVDVQDLILCDVEGFRGYYVCSSHPWEKMARVNPSFNDRGGVGQVNDPGHDFLPAPGGDDLLNSYLFSMVALSAAAVGTSYIETGGGFRGSATAPFTFEAVVYFESAPASAYVIASIYNSTPPIGDSSGWYVAIDSDRKVSLTGSGTAITTTKLTTHKAHRVSVVWDGAATAIYFDGDAQAMASTDPSINAGLLTNLMYFGAGPQLPLESSPDALGDIRFFNVARSASEVDAFWNAPIPATTTGLVAYWPTTEGQGTSVSDLLHPADPATIVDGDGWTTHAVRTNP